MPGEWFGYYVIDCVCICSHTYITFVEGIGLGIIAATRTLIEMIVIRCIIGFSVRSADVIVISTVIVNIIIIIAVVVIVKGGVFRLNSFVMTV